MMSTVSVSIQSFIENEKVHHTQQYKKQTAAQVLHDPMPLKIKDWNRRLAQQGYYAVTTSKSSVIEMINWCSKTFGRDHYTVTAGRFWFETEQAANWFALRWS